MKLQVYNLFLFMAETSESGPVLTAKTSENKPVLTREQLIAKIGPLGSFQFKEGLSEDEKLDLLKKASEIAEEVRIAMPEPQDRTRANQVIRARVFDETEQGLKIYHPMSMGHSKHYPWRSRR